VAVSARLREALELVLLFHASGPWLDEHSARWHSITGDSKTGATPKTLCDHIRKVLAESAEAQSPGLQQAHALATIFNALEALPVDLRAPTAEVVVAWAAGAR
jgi:hypothetical protein